MSGPEGSTRQSDDWLRRQLPAAVAERTRFVRGGAPAAGGELVLYWMRASLRGHENPALDAAVAIGNALALPVFVYHALSERYPFASDRHHTFILEGARDVAAELAERGIGYAFHLSRPEHRGPHLVRLARRAAVVVTEDMPVAPLTRWTAALAKKIDRPLLAVDAACVVPMRLVGRRFARAFAFRRATTNLRRERLRLPWRDVEPEAPLHRPGDLPFTPIDLAGADVAALVARCVIDHGVAPVAHTRGGCRAGYARWHDFRETALARYARDRNDALLPGVSRLSPYLHYGMVSPMRIAREAAAKGGDGARKFLDELLVWREVAYNLCFYDPAHETLDALPEWARETLEEHADDPRPALPSWETLARARTGDELWDAAQRSLLIHGELHNNLRMTWGKALLSWTPDPAAALALLIDLNHRYALDGRDPASYGGILWCLGLYDRPFEPARPILGTVRPRPTEDHARRLDLARYAERVARPTLESPPTVAVVGAGIAGLACARALADHGLAVRLFDKARGPGGRVSTRRDGEVAFDHGAQYFTARDPRFVTWVRSWHHDGVVAPWPRDGSSLGRDRRDDPDRDRAGRDEDRGDDEIRWVGTPKMSALGRHLAEGLELVCEIQVDALERADDGWRLRFAEGGSASGFEAVALALPAPQAAMLLAPSGGGSIEDLRERLAEVELAPCLALMVAFDRPLELDLRQLDLAGMRDLDAVPLAWVAHDSAKPGRNASADCWVLHATPTWSAAHLEAPRTAVAEAMLDAFAKLAGRPLPARRHLAVHRWRYARTVRPLGEDCLFDRRTGIGVCGDWCLGARVEAAFLSGTALAGRILGRAAQRERRHEAAQLQLFAESS